MAGAMRKMAVYLGLVEDDGYDGRGSTPTTISNPNSNRSPSVTGVTTNPRQVEREEPVRAPVAQPRSSVIPFRFPLKTGDLPGSPPWHPSHPNARAWRRAHR